MSDRINLIYTDAPLAFDSDADVLAEYTEFLVSYAADALNDSKPEVALKFVTRALSLMSGQTMTDFTLYQALVELRVQILLVLGRDEEALASAEEAKEKLPNNPAIARWIEKLRKNKPRGEA